MDGEGGGARLGVGVVEDRGRGEWTEWGWVAGSVCEMMSPRFTVVWHKDEPMRGKAERTE